MRSCATSRSPVSPASSPCSRRLATYLRLGLMSFPLPGIMFALDFPDQARHELPAAATARRYDARVRRPALSRQGRGHDTASVSDLLSAVGTFRALPRSRADLQLLGARHRRRNVLMSTLSAVDPQPCQRTSARPAPNARITKKILVLGATSGIAEATCRIWAAQGEQTLSRRAQPGEARRRRRRPADPRRSLRRHRRRRSRRHRQAPRAARPRHQLAHRNRYRLPCARHPRRPASRRARLRTRRADPAHQLRGSSLPAHLARELLRRSATPACWLSSRLWREIAAANRTISTARRRPASAPSSPVCATASTAKASPS